MEKESNKLPDRLVSNDDLRPIFRSLGYRLKLASNDFDGLIGFSLLYIG